MFHEGTASIGVVIDRQRRAGCTLEKRGQQRSTVKVFTRDVELRPQERGGKGDLSPSTTDLGEGETEQIWACREIEDDHEELGRKIVNQMQFCSSLYGKNDW